MTRRAPWLIGFIVLAACVGTRATEPVASGAQARSATTPAAAPARLRVEVVERYPHDPQAFTQGLLLDGNVLYESTGLEGRSSLRRVEVATGRVLHKVDQPPPIFSEGIALIGENLVQLTWKNGIVYQYDKKTFQRRRDWGYSGEGWGACYDGRALVTSDGSDRLAFRDPETMAVRREMQVMMRGKPVSQLNELECVDGNIYANVWNTESIVRIDARTGRVTANIDAAGLLSTAEREQTDVLNGIAYDAASRTFLITGKLWPTMFRVRFVPAS